MKKYNITRIWVIFLAITISTASCSDWLDVQPRSQIRDTVLFSDQLGFKSALAGVYSILTDRDLYAVELRFGMLGTLAQEWNAPTSNAARYWGEANYDFYATSVVRRIDSIWGRTYHAIANVNVILEMLEDRQHLFTGINYEIIKGEVLALRAFLHFDLLRLFGASFAVDPNRPSIPYVTVYGPLQSPQLRVWEAMERVLADFALAAEYLKVDPIHTGQVITVMDDNGWLINRTRRLNYYALRGLQARAFLWMQDFPNAALHAQKVIDAADAGKFRWTTLAGMQLHDRTGAHEQLWGLEVNNMNELHTEFFTAGAGNLLQITTTGVLQNIYFGGASEAPLDWRFVNLFIPNATNSILQKFALPPAATTAFYRNRMPMIKLPEMYFILAEAQFERDLPFLDALNEVRRHRGLGDHLLTDPALTPEVFYGILANEVRREFLGEGQLWFFHKRQNRPIIRLAAHDLVELNAYIFPLPIAEREGANRQDNRN